MTPAERRSTATGLTLLVALISACATPPTQAPSRESSQERATLPDTAIESAPAFDAASWGALDEDIDASMYEEVRRALQQRDWIAAQLAMPVTQTMQYADTQGGNLRASAPLNSEAASVSDEASAPNPAQLWHLYYEARIARTRGALATHLAILNQLSSQYEKLPVRLQQELKEHRLTVARQGGSPTAVFEAAFDLIETGGHSELSLADLEQLLWQSAQQIGDAEKYNGSRRGWVELGRISQIVDASMQWSALATWQNSFTAHPAAALAGTLATAAERDANTRRIALLVPLSGALAKAGDAVSRGFLSAYYAEQETPVAIDIIDSRGFENTERAYKAAVDKGAQIVVGPLGKTQVAQLLEREYLSAPLLTLNRPESWQPNNNPDVLMLSLAPEDEAQQLAREAYASGARRVLILRPEGTWGDRMESALAEIWHELGGRTLAHASYAKPEAYSQIIRDALSLDTSAARTREVRSLFNEGVETSGRRREDIDAILLLARNSNEARALKPLINYHYAGDLPTFALSTADTGSDDSSLNRDLDGLRMLAMPWRLNETAVPGHDVSATQGSGAALHALGADAYQMARRWWRMRSDPTPVYRGLTADLGGSVGGALTRRLTMAEFDRGTLKAR